MTNTEGGTDPEEFRTAAVRIAPTRRAGLDGLTMGAPSATATSTTDHAARVLLDGSVLQQHRGRNARTSAHDSTPSVEQQARIDKLKAELAKVREKVNDSTDLAAAQAGWEKTAADAEKAGRARPATFISSAGATLTKLPDKSILAGGRTAWRCLHHHRADQPQGITAVRLEALPDPSLPARPRARRQRELHPQRLVPRNPSGSTEPARGRYVRIELPGHERSCRSPRCRSSAAGEHRSRARPPNPASTSAAAGACHRRQHRANSSKPIPPRTPPRKPIPVGSGPRQEAELTKITLWNRTTATFNRGSAISGSWCSTRSGRRCGTISSPRRPAQRPLDPNGPSKVRLQNATDTYHQTDGSGWPPRRPSTPTPVRARGGPSRRSSASRTRRSSKRPGRRRRGRRDADLHARSHDASHASAACAFRSRAAAPRAGNSTAISDALALAEDQRSPQQKAEVLAYVKSVAPQFSPCAIGGPDRAGNGRDQPSTTMVMRELPPRSGANRTSS